MHHRGLGMRTLGRLAMAAALIVPVGAVVATSAGAAGVRNAAHCTIAGSLDSSTSNNGVGDNGGLLLAQKGSQAFNVHFHTTSNCALGIPVGTVAVVNTGHDKGTQTTASAVNCQTASTTTLGGTETITWKIPVGMGTSVASAQLRWTGQKTLNLSGSVSSTASANNVFKSAHVSAHITTIQSLASVASGGNCSATIPLTHFDFSGVLFISQ